MNCPVCERILAPTLSICPTCGAMMNDTVREELQTKITSGPIQKTELSSSPKPLVEKPVIKAAPPIRRTETAQLTTAKTSPTLVEFQNKNNVIPEWRLQMQNAVQQRIGSSAGTAVAPAKSEFPLSGSTALKVQPTKQTDPIESCEISDPRVASALKRINDSRKTYLPPAKAWKKSTHSIPAPMKPYRIVTNHERKAPLAPPETFNPAPKPNVLSMPVATPKRVTTELPKLDAAIEKAFELKAESVVIESPQPIATRIEPQTEFADIKSIRIKAEAIEIEAVGREEQTDEIEDLAPFSMRFGAGLFDLIIGGFAALLLLSPLAFTSGNWWTTGGFMTFAAVWAIVLFLYMTVTLGVHGKTFGMRLFSLELVDAVENEYPTLHQAAISSGLFILSLPLGGAGFLTVLFNEENRALHDLVSGTILVREF
jgi:uncharacterized RDD family membrane protein YckC